MHVDSRRNNDRRKISARTSACLGRGITACCDHDACAAQDAPKHRTRNRNATRNGDLGSVKHNPIGTFKIRTKDSERNRRVEEHKVNIKFGSQTIDPARKGAGRQENFGSIPFNPDRLERIES